MLVLSRKVGQQIIIGADIQITVIHIRRKQVRLGVSAPREVCVKRLELQKSIQEDTPDQRGLPPSLEEAEHATPASS